MLAIQEARFKRIEEAQKLEKQIAEATPEDLAALWKAGKLDVREYNRRYPRTPVPRCPEEQVYIGPRGGRYRIDSNGRKVYDVP